MLWLAPQPAVAFAGTILSGIGYALVFPSFGIEAMKQVPPASRGAALGAYAAFFDIGFGLAGPTTGLLAGAFGYPSVFAAGAFGAARRGRCVALLSAARQHNARLTISDRAREKNCRADKKLLHRSANTLMSRSPNFARACGRVPVGGHPDKRPDSRPEQTPRLVSAA